MFAFAWTSTGSTASTTRTFYDYYALYDMGWGHGDAALSDQILDNMLGSGYDTFRWFPILGASGSLRGVTNTDSVRAALSSKDRIAIERYTRMEGSQTYGGDVTTDGPFVGNPQQTFVLQRRVYVHVHRPTEQHLVARQSRSPVSFNSCVTTTRN